MSPVCSLWNIPNSTQALYDTEIVLAHDHLHMDRLIISHVYTDQGIRQNVIAMT